jgi:hypothetical protein
MKRILINNTFVHDLGHNYVMLKCKTQQGRRLCYIYQGKLELVEDHVHYTTQSITSRKNELVRWFGAGNRPYFPILMHDLKNDESPDHQLNRKEYMRMLANARKARYRERKRKQAGETRDAGYRRAA